MGASTALVTRNACASDRARLVPLASTISLLYPGDAAWFDRRFDDALLGRASCTVATVGGRLAGAAIETPKGAARLKLSTFWVSPEFRRLGVGSHLLGQLLASWERRSIVEAWVTTDLGDADPLMALMVPRGFDLAGLAADRYAEGRTELVMAWSPDTQTSPVARSTLS